MPQALFLDQNDDGEMQADVRAVDRDQLPEGDVLVRVLYSSLNYKDGLAVTGKGKIIRGAFPFIPGIDLVGEVEASEAANYDAGDRVIQTGWGLGETTWGGFSQIQRVRAAWLVPLPQSLSPQNAMTAGTAGFTAMLAVMALADQGLAPGAGEVVVTGASGGVGSFAVALLGALGYDVVASTGSEAAHAYLQDLGAARLIHRDELAQGPLRSMESARWAGAVDTVGGATLAAVIAQLERHGSVAACGNAGGFDLHTTVFPFILRGVSLLGIDSNTCPNDRRRRAWHRLADVLSEQTFDRIRAEVIGLEQIAEKAEAITRGQIRGRVVVDVNQ